MKFFAVLIVVMAVCAGCAKNKGAKELTAADFAKSPKAPQAKAAAKPTKTPAAPTKAASAQTIAPKTAAKPDQPVITPVEENAGRVAMVNESAKFAVLTFPLGNIPAPGQQLSLYRNGVKVAEVKVTGPQRDLNTVADVVAGDAQLDDEVRRR